MKKPLLFTSLILIVVLALGSFLYLKLSQTFTVTHVFYGLPQTETSTRAPGTAENLAYVRSTGNNGETCYQNSLYVISVKSRGNEVGSDFLIEKKAGKKVIPCVYDRAKGDLAITDLDAAYFLGLFGNFLVLDSGTAPPPRKLLVYNLNTGKKVLSDMYTRPLTTGRIGITYWTPTETKATAQKCPDLEKNMEDGLGTIVVSHVRYFFETEEKESLGEERCEAVQ